MNPILKMIQVIRIKPFHGLRICCALAVAFLVVACGGERSDSSSSRVKKKKDYSVNVVLCDLTASSINDNIDSIASRAAQIIYALPQPGKIVFLPVEEDIFVDPLLSFEKVKVRPKKPSERDALEEAYQKGVEEKAELIKAAILAEYQRIENELGERDPARSCIVNYIERANDFFLKETRDTTERKYTTRLFILSDMVEICNYSGLNGSRIRFTPGNERAVQEAVDNYQPDFDLSYLDEVYILAFTNTDFDRSKKLASVVIKNLWEDIFTKLNYRDAGLLSFEPMVPKF